MLSRVRAQVNECDRVVVPYSGLQNTVTTACCSGGLWPPSFGAQRAPLQKTMSLYFAILSSLKKCASHVSPGDAP